MPIQCDVVSVERIVFSDSVDMVLAPGVEGMLGILPRHAPLMTALVPGEVTIRKAGQEDVFIAVGGGFMEVRPDRVTILADSAERADEIDMERAEAARRRAEERLHAAVPGAVDFSRAEMALHRSLIRIKVAEHRKRKDRRTGPGNT
jgi:F-type H+-transporting ATPase subunit epsilon